MEKQLPKQHRGFRRRIRRAVGPLTSVDQHARLTVRRSKTLMNNSSGGHFGGTPHSALLQRVLSVGMALEENQEEEEEWLAGRTLDALGLTLEQVKKSAKRSAEGKPPVYCSSELARKEADLRELLQAYENRLQWLATGSRAWFGVVKASSVAVIVDCSDEALSDEATAEVLVVRLSRLLSEQLARKSRISLVRYGNTVEACPSLDLQCDRQESLAVAAEWIDGCEKGRGTSNLLSALKYALKLKQVDTVCCVVASKPDQDHQVIEDFVLQSLVGHAEPHLHFVSFGCDPTSRQLMKALIRAVGGSYHHNVMDDDGTFHDSSYDSVAEELKRIQNTLHELQLLRAKSHSAADTTDSSTDESQHLQGLVPPSDLAWLSFLTRPLAHPDGWACPTSDPFERLTSKEWLGLNSLQARQLDVYQVLEPDTFCPRQERLPLTGCTVRSQVYNVMLEVEWYDGTLRRVHVDVPKLDEYCDQLDGVMDVYQERLQGLTLGSRRRFGVISDPNVVLLVDTSSLVSGHLAQLQESLRKLLQEQFLPLDPAHQVVWRFNVVRYGSTSEAWQPELVECSADNLEEAWQWIVQWVCEGTRNLRSGIECVLECVEWAGSLLRMEENTGVYLITGGLPDQEEELICEDISRRIVGSGIIFNAVFFETDVQQEGEVLLSGRHGTSDQVATCLQSLAAAGGGRFHHSTLADLVWSDDALLLEEELEHARTCQQKVLQVLQRFDELCREQSKQGHCRGAPDDAASSPSSALQPPPRQPRHTLATAARLSLLSSRTRAEEGKGRGRGRGRCWSAPHDTPVVGFYLGKGLRKGLAASGRKDRGSGRRTCLQERLLRDVSLHTSSLEWLAQYGLRALGLELDQYRVQGSGRGQPQVYLHPSKKGGLVPLRLNRVELVGCVRGLKMAACVYNKRLKWLTSGSRHCFGCTAQDELVVLLDSSASMACHYTEMCAALVDLVVEQLVPSGGRFNVATFGGAIQFWQADLTVATKDVLVSLGNWLSSVCCCGNTRLLEAMQVTVDRFPTSTLHVVSDGGVDHSQEFFFRRLRGLRPSTVHTTAFHCRDWQHCCFLKELAEHTSGRHHVYPAALTLSPTPKTTPSHPQGHDVHLLLQEIQRAERWIEESRDLV